VTVMMESFFGMHKAVMQSGLYAIMKPGEKDLYAFLCFLSEHKCSRELRAVKDSEVCTWSGSKPRTLTDARKRLQEYGLIRCVKSEGNKYTYTICNPATGEPYPGTPKEKPSKYDAKGLEQMRQRLGIYLQPNISSRRKRADAVLTAFNPADFASDGLPLDFGR
jgi:hypothetical protein